MKIDDLDQLEKLIRLCRKTGISAIEIDNIKFNLNPIEKRVRTKAEPLADPLANASIPSFNGVLDTDDLIAASKASAAAATKALQEQIATPDMLTEDQLLNWSSRPESFEGQQ